MYLVAMCSYPYHCFQTICDGARAYAEQVHSILEFNGYYDFNDDEVFDVTDQVNRSQ